MPKAFIGDVDGMQRGAKFIVYDFTQKAASRVVYQVIVQRDCIASGILAEPSIADIEEQCALPEFLDCGHRRGDDVTLILQRNQEHR